MVGKLARAVAAVSVSMPVVVVIDDADRLELDLARILIENLIGRIDGQVLVVAAVNPGGDLESALTSQAMYGLTEGRVQTVDTETGMDYQARVDLAAELCPNLPRTAIHRIGQRTQTFAEVFAVASAEDLTELDVTSDHAIVKEMDKVINAQIDQAPPSKQAVVLAWAGGVMHATQAERALQVLEEPRPGDDDGDHDVIQFESLVRLADPASPRLAEKVAGLVPSKRHRLAKTALDTALEIGQDPQAGPVERVVAWQAVHKKRADLQDRTQLVGVQCQLVHGLEDLDDPAAAYEVAKTALVEYQVRKPDEQKTPEYNDLSAAVLRLALIRKRAHNDPLIDAMIAAAIEGGAVVGLEACIWAAIDLLNRRDQRERALGLTDQIVGELTNRKDLGTIGNRWRLLLAFHTGRAKCPAITQQLLAPMLDGSSTPENEDAARKVLYAVDGRQADTRLQVIGLEAELKALPSHVDSEHLRLHAALATDYRDLGDYLQALHHLQHELPLRRRIQGPDHRDTLTTRSNIASMTGHSGHPAEALQLFQELLPDWEQTLGRSDPGIIATRANIAFWTAQSGFIEEALQLARELLPDCTRIHGPGDPLTLKTRSNIASWTGRCGHPAEALRLFQELLPDQERVLGPDEPDTLRTQNNIAFWTGQCGHPAEALHLFQELLPDREQVLGPDHPDTLTTRNNVAYWTGESGHIAEALRLSQELLPDRDRVLGSDHPDTLGTRSNIAFWTANSGHRAEALRLFQELLPDQVRSLGPNHPHTVRTRGAIQQLSPPDTSPNG